MWSWSPPVTILNITADVAAVNEPAPDVHENWSPQGFWESWKHDYIYSVSWGALAFIFRDFGSKLLDKQNKITA